MSLSSTIQTHIEQLQAEIAQHQQEISYKEQLINSLVTFNSQSTSNSVSGSTIIHTSATSV